MALALGLAATLVGAPAPTPAPASARVPLEWSGDACDEARRTAARIDDLLPPDEAGPGGRARVRIEPDPSAPAQWIATIEIETDGGMVTRTLRGAPCSSLADAIALVVAVTVDPLGASTRVDARDALESPPVGTIPEPAEAAPGPAEAALDPTTSSSSESPRPGPDVDPGPRSLRGTTREAARDRPRPSPPLSSAIVVEGGGAIGLQPRIGGRLGGAVALGIGPGRITLAGLHVFARRVTHPLDDAAGADLALSAARLSGGWSFRSGRFTFPLCAGIEVGAFTAQGVGLEDRATARAAWVAIVPHAQPTLWATRWLGIGLHVEAPIALTRPRFHIDDFVDDLLRVGPVGFRFGLSIEVKFFDEAGRTRRRGSGSG